MSGTHTTLEVLLVEDNPGDARLVERHLNASHVSEAANDVTLTHVETLPEGLSELARRSYDTLFLDLGLPESTGLATLDRVLAAEPRVPVVVLTGLDDRETAVRAIQSGAQDYLPKDNLDPDTLARTLRYAVERHQQEAELRRQNERLDRFASVVSHDLRNPLTVAKGRCELLREEYEREHVAQIAESLDRMERLIDDLLTLARQGKTIGTPEVVALPSLVDDCRTAVETGRAEIVVEADRSIYADGDRLEQLLENLFRNAVEHNDPPVTVTVGVDGDALYVEDDGSGVPEMERDRIFEGGYSTSRDGTGFGLMIVEEIVSAHGWEIAVTDGDDDGARFELTGVEFADG